jgi:hypothetical protein
VIAGDGDTVPNWRVVNIMPSRSEPHRSTKSTVKPTAELYRVEEILQERKGEKVREILVRWAGIDERTGRAWPLEWVRIPLRS